MIQTKNWLHKLALLYEVISAQADQTTKQKCMDLMKKSKSEELAIAFCGHFSAGKSSLMNDLFGFPLLPTSPIPTSANVVKVKKGPDRIQLHFLDGQIQQVTGTFSETAFQALCQNGDKAIEVDIERLDLPLPKGVAIVDTPGIDSTDATHRFATEAQLHVSDVIFYMMDYNHVQAEGNLQFVKSLTKRGKRVYLIINQIDKHRDTELSFSSFQQSVSNSFAAWDISVAEIFYTSLKQPNHPHNEFQQVKALLHDLYAQREQLIEQNIQQESNYLLTEHINQQAAAYPPLETCQEQHQKTTHNIAQIQEQLAKLQVEKQQITGQLMKDLDKILQNAYLMPANLREQAKAYLETMQPSFKVGLFFSKSKTEQARKNRENDFCLALTETVTTQLAGHVEELVLQHARLHGIYQEQLGNKVHAHLPTITTELLLTTIKKGAEVNGNYVLTYTTDLVEQIKTNYRMMVRRYLSDHIPKLEEKIQYTIDQVILRLQETTDALAVISKQIEAHHQLKEQKQHLIQILKEDVTAKTTISVEKLLTDDVYVEQTVLSAFKPAEPTVTSTETAQLESETTSFKRKQELLRQAETVLQQIPDLDSWYQQLVAKRCLMENQQFTVALFGAFSAGKSSFANALLGENILPVSPNPTTAAICRICPPNEQFTHGHGTVTFKSKETLINELKLIYQLFRQETSTLEDAISRLPSLLTTEVTTTRQKMALPFLRAIEQRFASMENLLGTTQEMTQQEATVYMADEAKSAFVEEISLYYDSNLAKLGITLVDTPGADSLHARHTDVAFRYMKQADALLFVTYYNHAFSRADRELLIQLGRVQDSFALDKMYFIVNAADLASSDKELTKVVSYVESQLQQYGIRHPRMYAVSSLASLEEKQTNQKLNTAFANFEQAFMRFIQEDSRNAMIQRMIKDVEQAITWIEGILTALHTSEEEKKMQRSKWQQAKTELLQQFATWTSTAEERALQQEAKTLLYYVGERIRLRYYDEFAALINPSTIRESGKAGRKQLTAATLELCSFLGHDFVQELRATTLRMEKWINQTMESVRNQQEEMWQSLLAGLSLAEPNTLSIPDTKWTYPIWNEQDPHLQHAVSIYKNNHSFFEGNGRDKMKEECKKLVHTTITKQLEHATMQINDLCLSTWQQGLQNLADQWSKQVNEHFSRMEATLQRKVEEQPLIDAKAKLEQLMSNID